MEKNLHDAIVKVLSKRVNGLTYSEISNIIAKEKLWRLPSDKNFPPPSQISTRVNKYPRFFENIDGKIFNKVRNEVRLFRLTYNENMWHRPSIHRWSIHHQNNTDVAHENQFGFGGEEWLFNPNFQDEDFQYGYIRGVENLSEDIKKVDKAYLFTINQETSERFLVAIINDLEIIKNTVSVEKAKELFKSHKTEMLRDLEIVGADLKGFSDYFIPTVRFKASDVMIFDELIPAPVLEGRKYNRFQPYKVDDNFESTLTSITQDQRFIFRPGIAKNKNKYDRSTTSKTSTIQRVHSDITNKLVTFLKPEFSVEKKNISIEKSGIGLNTPDLVLKHSDSEFTLFEIKTSISGRKNIREALGQLIDYSYWDDSIKVRAAIVVSPSLLSEKEKDLFKQIKKNIRLNIRYLQFTKNSKQKSFEYIL